MGKKSNNMLRQLNRDAKMASRRLEEIIDIRECGKEMSHIEEEVDGGIGNAARNQEKRGGNT
ncbi:hypothetical protein HYT26_01475 [Candidatus Pacearchaeota archaeon]|nr:hypothetical protein [Candidatus Pacearchaeota archaeon]